MSVVIVAVCTCGSGKALLYYNDSTHACSHVNRFCHARSKNNSNDIFLIHRAFETCQKKTSKVALALELSTDRF